MNADIPEYVAGNRHNHKATQPRKLLLHRRELNKLMAAVQRDGMTIVPLKLYFNEHGKAKLLLGLARGRKKAISAMSRKTRLAAAKGQTVKIAAALISAKTPQTWLVSGGPYWCCSASSDSSKPA